MTKEKEQSEQLVKGFKGFNKDMTCRGFQYEAGKDYVHEGKVQACNSGFHFCEHPLNTFAYYPPSRSTFCEVEGSGEIDKDSDDTKVAVSKLKIGCELSFKAMVEAAIKFTFERAKWEDKDKATGYQGAASATGRYGAASATGDQGAASATGDQGAASATGRYGAASATGRYGAASATGDQGAASATGYQGAASATGEKSVACALGYGGKAKASKGSAIVVIERDDYYNIVNIKSAIIDGEVLKEDTYYILVDGEFKEVD